MNIVTRALMKKVKNREITEFIKHWDALEALVIRVYRSESALLEDEREYSILRKWLNKHYPPLQAILRGHWQRARVAGGVAREDPFVILLSATDAKDFTGNWSAMQTLPAAREALNSLLLTMQGEDS